MGLFSHFSKEHRANAEFEQLTRRGPNEGSRKASVTHQLLAGAAAYAACKAYQDHKRRHGRPVNHAQAKQIACGLAGVMVDRLIESRGLTSIDNHRAKDAAMVAVMSALDRDGY
ncbi:uncharacterized protein MELLADRAFT_105591 [Melampsora larici-populina 98AG31]|uniref:Uncharacterized protein n=1 Tax=Melampsora larici-populina (strain 98AG31 / pathotype 3-4-7) TaxID=747676 RepID=F4RIQ7_MELLP|nr:uncharacterized protein MELLADRAFT_105591 [Melampsora larici-populina 98AG31]EGG07602.1 hypothetical protein MELLADRAFT_105591 [Melampsora larici-populina 98AG31]